MLRAAGRWILRTALLAGLFVGMIAGGFLAVDRLIIHADGPHDSTALVIVKPGDGHATIRWTLKRAGVIRELYHYDAARILAGPAYVPKEGEYEIPPGASVAAIMDIIHAGRSFQRRLTVIEGMTSADIIEMLEGNEHFSGDVTLAVPEGSILPETYFFTTGTARDAFIARMQEKRQIGLLEAWVNRADDLPYETPEEALIMASVIELETANSADRREVAGVFVNRLRTGMRLQSDPTVLYGVEGGAGRAIRKSDLRRMTDWNTYVIKGLPKTPICNPSQDSIDAALRPAVTKNIYFVSDGKGGLLFARNLETHNKNVRKYRRIVNGAGN